MPDGRTHALASLAGAAVVPAAMVYYGFPMSEVVSCSAGFVVSLVVNPDLDLNRRFPKRSPAKWLWWLMWFPYSRLISHRSIWSHFPLIGTTLRVAYLMVISLFILHYMGYTVEQFGPSLYWVLYGLVISDIIHVSMDAAKTIIRRFMCSFDI